MHTLIIKFFLSYCHKFHTRKTFCTRSKSENATNAFMVIKKSSLRGMRVWGWPSVAVIARSSRKLMWQMSSSSQGYETARWSEITLEVIVKWLWPRLHDTCRAWKRYEILKVSVTISYRHRVNATPKRKNFIPFSNSAGIAWTGSLLHLEKHIVRISFTYSKYSFLQWKLEITVYT